MTPIKAHAGQSFPRTAWARCARMLAVLTVLVSAGFAVVHGAGALTVEATDFDRLLVQAQEIYKAQVIAVTCDWSGEGVNRHIATFVRLRVLESYRGAVQGERTLEFFGGRMGEKAQRIVGMPEFQAGDVEILFVRDNHRNLSPLVGVYHGRLRVVRNAVDGREKMFLHDSEPLTDVSLIGADRGARASAQLTSPSGPLSAREFAQSIQAGLKRRGIAPDEP